MIITLVEAPNVSLARLRVRENKLARAALCHAPLAALYGSKSKANCLHFRAQRTDRRSNIRTAVGSMLFAALLPFFWCQCKHWSISIWFVCMLAGLDAGPNVGSYS